MYESLNGGWYGGPVGLPVPWAAWQAYQLHPDRNWLAAHHASFRKYVTVRFDLDDPVPTMTPGSWGTGAEYQPSFYQHTPHQPWDWRYDVEGHNESGFPIARLWRLDDLCYHLLSMRGCAHYRCDDGATWSIANDYFHSSWLDPFMSCYLGIRVEDGQVRFDFFHAGRLLHPQRAHRQTGIYLPPIRAGRPAPPRNVR